MTTEEKIDILSLHDSIVLAKGRLEHVGIELQNLENKLSRKLYEIEQNDKPKKTKENNV